jgi:hypothetical protein
MEQIKQVAREAALGRGRLARDSQKQDGDDLKWMLEMGVASTRKGGKKESGKEVGSEPRENTA